ncbi:HdeD family acid-resistance protein [Thalassotalea litorea]|uniref:HdeD family acid-resistance protein n=1 Tax=Thalassotalea litorea TaxID=2020715 RepID=A0A5R9IJ20_9GAMM|nr:HdeD family acid-resistance protein [Thalassotalea litorea]TLU64589.1 HdeD family acid-resistance protein [Thalassotalea litorea]
MSIESDAIQDTSRIGMAFGILIVILGILAMVAPMIAGMSIAVMVGLILLFAGIVQIVFALKAQSFGSGLLKFLFGGISVLGGLFMMIMPAMGLITLTIVLLVYFIIEGIFTIIIAFQYKPQQGWGWMLFSGVVTLVLAWMIWKSWPVSGAWAVGILVGVRLLFSGFSIIFTSMATKKLAQSIEKPVN